MSTPEIDAFAQRLDLLQRSQARLQRQCVLWKRLATGVLVSAALLCVAGAAAQRANVIEAEGFTLVDGTGKATAKLFNTPDGKPVLSFFHQGANVLNIGVSSEGIADLVFYDRAGKLRIGLILAEDNATLGLYDPTRKSGVTLSSANDGSSGIGLFHRDRKDRITLGTQPDGTGHIKILGPDGKVQFHAPSQ